PTPARASALDRGVSALDAIGASIRPNLESRGPARGGSSLGREALASSPVDDGDRRVAERAQSTLGVGLDSTVRDASVPATRRGPLPPVAQPAIADDTHAAG